MADAVSAQVNHTKFFLKDLFAFVGINLLLFVINYFTGFGVLWFLWPLGIWSIVIFIHALFAFVLLHVVTKPEEEQKAQEILAEETDVVSKVQESAKKVVKVK